MQKIYGGIAYGSQKYLAIANKTSENRNMKIPKIITDTATKYWHKICELEKALGAERRARKKAETALEKTLKEKQKLEEELENLKRENGNLKECKKTYAKMIFKGNTKKVSKLKRGGKIGHRGISRPKPSEEEISAEIDVELKNCLHCGAIFSGCKRKYEHIIEDLVITSRVDVKRYWIHQYECGGCGKSSTAKSKEIFSQSPFGRKTFATILVYRYRAKVPLAKIAEILKDIHGLTISESGIQGILAQAAVQFGEKFEQLKEMVRNGKNLHADETHWRVNGENWWTWLWGNDQVTVYTTENTRGHGIPKKMLEGFDGVLVRDGYDGYNCVHGEQQICWVHLLRKAHEYCERPWGTTQMKKLKDLLKEAYAVTTKWHREEHTDDERLQYHSKKRQELIDLSKQKKWTGKDVKTFLEEWIVQHKDRLMTFLKYQGASPENNPAERAIRPMVVFRKITGGSKSAAGAKITDINMSIMETWKKQNLPFMQSLPVFGLSL